MSGNIFLIGFMGTGKSTVSRKMGNILKVLEVDMDYEIEARQNMKISEIFSTYGEEYFRGLETALVREFEQKNGYIVSCGGGVVLRNENVESMKRNGRIVLLTASPKTIYERVRHNQNRPLLKNNMSVEYIAELMSKRIEFYETAADIKIDTDGKEPEEIAKEIIRNLKA